MGNYHMGTFTSKVPIRAIRPVLPATARTCSQRPGVGCRAGNGNFQTQSSLDPSSGALREIQPIGAEQPLSEVSVFGLTSEALANRVRDAARVAGLGDGFSRHSGRIGMARGMVAAEAPTAVIQH